MKSDTPAFPYIEERLKKLELQNRRFKWAGIAILIAFSSVLLMGQAAPVPQVIEAQKFVLKDADGNVRGWLGVYATGSELTLGNANKEPRMTLMGSDDASALHFYGSHNGGMTLDVNSGNPAISMAGADGNGGTEIAFSKVGPGLTLTDRMGLAVAVGAVELKAHGEQEPNSTSAASVLFLDKNRNVTWKAP